jgi:hypothetical protein
MPGVTVSTVIMSSLYKKLPHNFAWPIHRFSVPFLYKTEINSLARVTKIKDMVKNGAYNYITNHNRPVYTSDTFLYEFYSDWVPSPAMPLVNL